MLYQPLKNSQKVKVKFMFVSKAATQPITTEHPARAHMKW